jgi:hypothetical protein
VLEHHQLPVGEWFYQHDIYPIGFLQQIREDLIGKFAPGRVQRDGAGQQPGHLLAVEQRERAAEALWLGQRDGPLDSCSGPMVVSPEVGDNRGDKPSFHLGTTIDRAVTQRSDHLLGELRIAMDDECPPQACPLLVSDGRLFVA